MLTNGQVCLLHVIYFWHVIMLFKAYIRFNLRHRICMVLKSISYGIDRFENF
jgi:hypothetical protein